MPISRERPVVMFWVLLYVNVARGSMVDQSF